MSVEMLVLCLRRYGEHVAAKREAQRPQPRQEALPSGEADQKRFTDFLSLLSVAAIAERTEADWLTETLRDPVISTLRLKARDIGWHLWANGGTKEMNRIADLVAEAMPDHPALALSTLDKWWSGIGSDKGQWLA